MISYTWTHIWWLSQLATQICIKVWRYGIFFIWECWILLGQTYEIECWNMILTDFLNRILLNHGWWSNFRFYFFTFLLFIKDIRNLWCRLSLSFWNVIIWWLICLSIAWFIARWLSRFLRKRLVITTRLEWWGVLKECLWDLLSYRCLMSCLFSFYPKDFTQFFLVFGFG